MSLPATIRINEVGPRDGLQNEKSIVSTNDKVAFIDLLSQTGVAEIEVSSFVSPKWVPQLSDADEVFSKITRREGIIYSALVPNLRGLERALNANVDKVSIFASASETFSRKNINATIDESIDRFRPLVEEAKKAALPIRGYISCVVACPYEGPVDPGAVRDLAERLLDLGVDEIDLGETIGVAVPTDIEMLYDEFEGLLEPSQTTLHLHNTRGTALACAYRALQLGVTRFDASCAGLGGCPYAPGAAGNLATEDLVYLCDQMNCMSGVELEKLFKAGRHIALALGRKMTGRVFSADGADTASGSS
ncbi:MAG: hydroxymethylglutaryl-CoA lyase [Planctomycetota bacterium]|nr:hydroxymethylglutaryl-CoA lyase [Planctomycetota bacterium]